MVSTNVVRVIMSVVALNRIIGSEIGLWEILHHYTVHRTPKGVYYFKKGAHKEELIQYLPDSERGDDDDFFVVSGNWQYAPGDGGLYEIPHRSYAPNCTTSFCTAPLMHLFFPFLPLCVLTLDCFYFPAVCGINQRSLAVDSCHQSEILRATKFCGADRRPIFRICDELLGYTPRYCGNCG